MAVYTMYPVIEMSVLENEIKTQFNVDVEDRLSNILFGDDCYNDCYKSYCFENDEEFHGHVWEDEEDIRIRNLVNAYLRDILPGYTDVLIDIIW